MIEIDGSVGEGGGQVLRTSLTLSALTGQPVRLRHIRAKRRAPGLAPQHLAGVRAIAAICKAELTGDNLRSTQLTFRPQTAPQAGSYTFDVTEAAQGGSAGSMSLVFQTLWLPLAFAAAESQVTLKGGTHVAWSPPFDYLTGVYLPTLEPMGLTAVCTLDRWGFYPVGGGQFTAIIEPTLSRPLKPLTLIERGDLRQVRGAGVACNLPSDIAQRITNRAMNGLRQAKLPAHIRPQRVSGAGPGAGIFLIAEYDQALAGFTALGKKGKPSDVVADEACQELLAHHHSGAAVEPHLADQLLLPLALAQGQSEFQTSTITQHLLTNAQIIRRFIPARIDIDGLEGQSGRVVVEGVGFMKDHSTFTPDRR